MSLSETGTHFSGTCAFGADFITGGEVMKKFLVLGMIGLGLATSLTATFSITPAAAGTQDCKAKRTC
jgi:hypothetical protein